MPLVFPNWYFFSNIVIKLVHQTKRGQRRLPQTKPNTVLQVAPSKSSVNSQQAIHLLILLFFSTNNSSRSLMQMRLGGAVPNFSAVHYEFLTMMHQRVIYDRKSTIPICCFLQRAGPGECPLGPSRPSTEDIF